MKNISAKIDIAGRRYSIKTTLSDEDKVRKVGALINEKIRSYREKFGDLDKQDLLAMVAFDAFSQELREKERLHEANQAIAKKISDVDQLITQAMQS